MVLNAYLMEQPDTQVPSSRLDRLGVVHWNLDPSKYKDDAVLEAICDKRKYTYRDYVHSQKIPNLKDKLDNFMIEHLHDDEEIRYFLEGSGYFDLRDGLSDKEEWVRIHCKEGDMIVLPAGIYHRFVPDDKMFFHVMRLFQGEPVWTAHNRKEESTDSRPARTQYVTNFLSSEPNAYLMKEPDTRVPPAKLEALGVVHWKLDPNKYKDDPVLEDICKERGYTYRDYVNSTTIPNLKDKLDNFMIEHLHDDEEIRYFLEGSGYFDLRDGLSDKEEWVRIHCKEGDMIVLPAGIYHRFVPDDKMFFHVMRLFQGEPVWTPHNRKDEGTEARQARTGYVANFLTPKHADKKPKTVA